jgi:O-antigen ligase
MKSIGFSISKGYEKLLVLLGVILSALAGLAFPEYGFLVAGGVIAVIAALAALAYPFLGALAVSATIPVENMIVLDESTFTRLLGIAVFGIWIASKLYRRETWARVLTSGHFILGCLLVALSFISYWWAVYPNDVFAPAFSLFQKLLFSLLVIDLVTTWQRAEWLVKTLMLATLLAALLTVEQFLTGDVTYSGRAGSGIAGGLNNTAQVLTTILPFGFYLIRSKQTFFWRLVGIAYIATSVGAVAMTFSRASLSLLGLILLAEYWQTLKQARALIWLMIATALAIVLGLQFIPQEKFIERVESIGPGLEAMITGDEYGQTNQRGYYMRVGWAIFEDHPYLGAGYENYRRLYLEYQFIVPGATDIFTDPRSPHNSYIGFLANLGVQGLLLFLALMGLGVWNAFRAWRMLATRREFEHFYLVQALFFSLAIQFGFAFASPAEKEKLVWLLLGLSVAVLRLVQSYQGKEEEPAHADTLS